jgi:hypothetical protein
MGMDIDQQIRKRFELVAPVLDERRLRLDGAAEALALGSGGISLVSRATGISRPTITWGGQELSAAKDTTPPQGAAGRMRKSGGGRKRTATTEQTLRSDRESLIEPVTRGAPDSPLRWTSKRVRRLAGELNSRGHHVRVRIVTQLLRAMDYSLQANRQVLEGSSPPDRAAQFAHIHQQVKAVQASGQPVLAVDTKKTERVGAFRNHGRELRPTGDPANVRGHDLASEARGNVAPYGVDDQTHQTGWVHGGTDHDPAAFAVESIRRWWHMMGRPLYPHAPRLLMTADGGGSHGARTRWWTIELQQLANATGLEMAVSHVPPGTSKWHTIEHRRFSSISHNWRGTPLVSHEVIVNLRASTTPHTGLPVRCELDTNQYPKGIKVTNEAFNHLNLVRDEFHGEWNYTIKSTPSEM